jgi:syntaxin-binding protein 1
MEWTLLCLHAPPTARHTRLPPAVVDDIAKRREPLPALLGIYFITPSDAAVKQLIRDFALGSMPQYKAAYVFFSGRVSRQQVEAIKECQPLVARLRGLKEVRRRL